MRQSFNSKSSRISEIIKDNLIILMVLLTVGQAYMPHGEGMQDQVDDLMDQLDDMFRKKGDDSEEDINIEWQWTSLCNGTTGKLNTISRGFSC